MATKKQGKLSQFQVFDTDTISRADIHNAPYNPRIMDKGAQKRLREGLRKHGLVQPIVWNKRTGNLVGGHQRLEQLDALERSADYDLTVAVIDVDEREEAEINIQLNNPSMQGDWDLDKLADIADEFSMSFEDMGFSSLDVDLMFDGDDRFSELFDTPEAQETEEAIQAVRDARMNGKAAMEGKASIEWYSIIVFESPEERRDFYKRIGVPPYEDYISVDQWERILR